MVRDRDSRRSAGCASRRMAPRIGCIWGGLPRTQSVSVLRSLNRDVEFLDSQLPGMLMRSRPVADIHIPPAIPPPGGSGFHHPLPDGFDIHPGSQRDMPGGGYRVPSLGNSANAGEGVVANAEVAATEKCNQCSHEFFTGEFH